MNVETAVYRLLTQDSGVSGIVSSRVFGGVLKQDVVYPAIAYRPSGPRRVLRVMEGGCALFSQQMAVFSVTDDAHGAFKTSVLLDEAVFAALDEFSGTVSDGGSPEDTLEIQAIFSGHVAHEYQHRDLGGKRLHEFLTEFDVHYIDPTRSS